MLFPHRISISYETDAIYARNYCCFVAETCVSNLNVSLIVCIDHFTVSVSSYSTSKK